MMHQEQRQQTEELLRRKRIDRALFANMNSVKWLTGFAPSVQVGPNFFLGGPPVVWYDDGHFTLIVLDTHAELAGSFGQQPEWALVSYLGYTTASASPGTRLHGSCPTARMCRRKVW
jgi:Xaa-Pro aminopeptidase